MPWLLLGLLAATTVVLGSRSSSSSGGGDTPGHLPGHTGPTIAEGKAAGILDARSSKKLAQATPNKPVAIVTPSWLSTFSGTEAEGGYEAGFKEELFAEPGFSLEGPFSRDAKVVFTTAYESTNQGDDVQMLTTEERYGASATAEDPLKGYVKPSGFSAKSSVFEQQLLERVDYVWAYLASLEPLAVKMRKLRADNPSAFKAQKPVVDRLLDEDLRFVLGSSALFIQSAADAPGSSVPKMLIRLQEDAGSNESLTMVARYLDTGPNALLVTLANEFAKSGVPLTLPQPGSDLIKFLNGPDGAIDQCKPAGFCSMLTAFNDPGFPANQKAAATEAFKLLKDSATTNPMAAASYALQYYFLQNWMATAPTSAELSKITASDAVYYRRFYEVLVAAIGTDVASSVGAPVYEWTAIVRQAWAGWDGGVDGARKSGYGWPGASGVAFAHSMAKDMAFGFREV